MRLVSTRLDINDNCVNVSLGQYERLSVRVIVEKMNLNRDDVYASLTEDLNIRKRLNVVLNLTNNLRTSQNFLIDPCCKSWFSKYHTEVNISPKHTLAIC